MLKEIALSLGLTLALVGAAPVQGAEDPKQISWEELMPQLDEIKNPFDDLKPEVLDRFGYVMRAREDLKMDLLKKDSDEYQDALAIERELLEEGVDVKGLILAAEKMMAEVDRRATVVNEDLDGKLVRMPGYALPLEQSEAGATELLLVPYVGACIHVPPPPANQIVYVKLAEPYKVTNLYQPIWITGTMATEASSRKLSLVDGVAPIATGYRMDGFLVEPYE